MINSTSKAGFKKIIPLVKLPVVAQNIKMKTGNVLPF